MQDINAALQAELDKGQVEPIVLVDLYEFYDYDYVPGVNGFDPNDAIEKFAAEEITWNGLAYRRELKDRSDIVRNMGEKTNNVTLNFSNISRYMATLAQTTPIEGLLLAIRTVSPSVTTDSVVIFHGRCDKPSDIDKGEFTLQARQDFGNINNMVPPDKFQADDPEGRLPSDPLFEGIPFNAVMGSVTFPQVVPSTSFFGRLFGRRDTVYRTQQWSSVDGTPLGQVIPECFGRVQMQLIPIAWADKGSHVGYLMVACKGPIAGMDNIKSRTQGWGDPVCNFAGVPAGVHLGDPGGTGTNTGNSCQGDLGAGLMFSNLAYIDGASLAPDPEAAVGTQDEPPTIVAIIRGRVVPLPDGSDEYTITGWTDNPVHIARFILTAPKWININPAFMQDDVLAETARHCDFPLVDNTNTQVIPIVGPDIGQAGGAFRRYLPTGNINPRFVRFNELGDVGVIPEFEDGPYTPLDPGDPLPDPSDPSDPTFLIQKPLRKRYTANFPITESVPAVDLLYKTLFPAAKLYMRVNKFGRYEIRSEQPSDSTWLRVATVVNDTSIPVLDVTPWKTGPDLLKGRILLGFGLTTSEVRTPTAAAFTADGNAITLAASASGGGVTATASGANLTGGSSTVQASGTITIGGTPAAGNTVTATINGIAVSYRLESIDTTGTTAAMLHHYINANPRLNKYVKAVWDSATPTVITIVCLFGLLTVPALLKAHTIGIADPTTAPTVAAAGSGVLAAGTYKVAYSDVTATGTTALTALASVVLTANQQINLSSLPALTGTSRDFYISERANSTNLRFAVNRTNNSDFSINSLPLPDAAIPPGFNSTSEEMLRVAMSFATNSQDVFPAWAGSASVILNDIYLPTTANGHKYKVTTAGTTGTTEPSWPTGAGATVASGTAVFTEDGSTVLQQAGLTRANITKNSYKWPLGSREQSTNQVKGDFRDAKNDFALTPFTYNDRAHQAQVKKTYSEDLDLTAVDSVFQVARIGGWKLSKVREGDWFNSLGTGPRGLVLEEGDVICSSDDSGGHINVVTRIEDMRIKPNHDVLINQARRYSTTMFADDVGAHRIPMASTLKYVQTKDSIIQFLDLPPIRDDDGLRSGFYVAVSHDSTVDGDWRGWELFADYGDGYAQVAKGDIPAAIGTASTTLATVSDPSVFDRVSSFTFTLDYVDPVNLPTSVTETELLANPRRNLFAVKNEYVQAATIVPGGGNTFTASTLLRGRFGTDSSEQLTHGASERVVWLNSAEKLVFINPVRVNSPYDYKVKTTNQDLADADIVPFTWTGGSLLPVAPSNLKTTTDASDNTLMEWTRRSRIGSGMFPGSDVPIAEEKELYIVEILNGSNEVIRTIDVTPERSGDPALLVPLNDSLDAAFVSGNNLLDPGNTHVLAYTKQQLGVGSWIEATLTANVNDNAQIGIVQPHVAKLLRQRGTAWPLQTFYSEVIFGDTDASGKNQFSVYHGLGGPGYPAEALNTGDIPQEPLTARVRIEITDKTRYYWDYTGPGATPFFESDEAPPVPLVGHVSCTTINNAGCSVSNVRVGNTFRPSVVYTAADKAKDLNAGVSWRVAQVSGVVGRGRWATANF